eukprot:TRINITY_DN28597_c0_g1_i1.p1 TRINITY_DN28597_c0_g1~~TRINITY_DN28597_c0_g1_i1.p1  ORF type:complete len:506 (+),score=68.03 TRINITY_DN28597_c0_g1_i1:107-1624(+)
MKWLVFVPVLSLAIREQSAELGSKKCDGLKSNIWIPPSNLQTNFYTSFTHVTNEAVSLNFGLKKLKEHGFQTAASLLDEHSTLSIRLSALWDSAGRLKGWESLFDWWDGAKWNVGSIFAQMRNDPEPNIQNLHDAITWLAKPGFDQTHLTVSRAIGASQQDMKMAELWLALTLTNENRKSCASSCTLSVNVDRWEMATYWGSLRSVIARWIEDNRATEDNQPLTQILGFHLIFELTESHAASALLEAGKDTWDKYLENMEDARAYGVGFGIDDAVTSGTVVAQKLGTPATHNSVDERNIEEVKDEKEYVTEYKVDIKQVTSMFGHNHFSPSATLADESVDVFLSGLAFHDQKGKIERVEGHLMTRLLLFAQLVTDIATYPNLDVIVFETSPARSTQPLLVKKVIELVQKSYGKHVDVLFQGGPHGAVKFHDAAALCAFESERFNEKEFNEDGFKDCISRQSHEATLKRTQSAPAGTKNFSDESDGTTASQRESPIERMQGRSLDQ